MTTKKESIKLIWFLPLAAFVVYLVNSLTNILFATFIAACIYFWYKFENNKRRRAMLMEIYNDKRIVDDIMNKRFWQGQTEDQLIYSLGFPVAKDKKVLKTKKKEVWKYRHISGNRYGLRITLENDIVIGWEKKS